MDKQEDGVLDCSLNWETFASVDIRVGTIIHAEVFAQARRPAYILHIDLGPLGIRKSSAQITECYGLDELINKQIMAVVNFPPKQIGPIQSECLVLGFYTANGVVLAVPDKLCQNGDKLG